MTTAPPPVLSVHRALKSVIFNSANLTWEDIQGEIEGKPTYGCLYEASRDLVKQLSSLRSGVSDDGLSDEEDSVCLIIFYYSLGKKQILIEN